MQMMVLAQGEERAFRWIAEESMQSVEKWLTDRGLLPSAWVLKKVNALTPNGVVLVGRGEYKVQMKNGDNETQTRAWPAVIPRGNLF
jgi:hypothetical protein